MTEDTQFDDSWPRHSDIYILADHENWNFVNLLHLYLGHIPATVQSLITNVLGAAFSAGIAIPTSIDSSALPVVVYSHRLFLASQPNLPDDSRAAGLMQFLSFIGARNRPLVLVTDGPWPLPPGPPMVFKIDTNDPFAVSTLVAKRLLDMRGEGERTDVVIDRMRLLAANSSFANAINKGLQPAGATKLWTPDDRISTVSDLPLWLPSSSSLPGLIHKIQNGVQIDDLTGREFEHLIGELLQKEGWSVEVTQASRDGGIDVIATRDDRVSGPIMTVWQAKRYKATRKVTIKEIRELSAVTRDRYASKGLVVTTSSLTKDARDYIAQRELILGGIERPDLDKWILSIIRTS